MSEMTIKNNNRTAELFSVKYSEMFFSGSGGTHGPDLPSPFENFSSAKQSRWGVLMLALKRADVDFE